MVNSFNRRDFGALTVDTPSSQIAAALEVAESENAAAQRRIDEVAASASFVAEALKGQRGTAHAEVDAIASSIRTDAVRIGALQRLLAAARLRETKLAASAERARLAAELADVPARFNAVDDLFRKAAVILSGLKKTNDDLLTFSRRAAEGDWSGLIDQLPDFPKTAVRNREGWTSGLLDEDVILLPSCAFTDTGHAFLPLHWPIDDRTRNGNGVSR